MKYAYKFSLLFALLLLVSASKSFSQPLKDFFKNPATPLIYLGIDYTQNLIINDDDANTADITGRLYSSINSFVVKVQDSKNYDIGGAFGRRNTISIDTTAVAARNRTIDAGKIISSNKSDFKRLMQADIANCVEALSLEGKEGIGMLFIMEGMKKLSGKGYGSVWVTLINMKTKEVLMSERIEHEAEGFGFRNYWVSVIRKTIIDIDWSKYKAWKKKYAR